MKYLPFGKYQTVEKGRSTASRVKKYKILQKTKIYISKITERFSIEENRSVACF